MTTSKAFAFAAALSLASLGAIGAAQAQSAASMHANPMVGGAPMYANKTIVENAVRS